MRRCFSIIYSHSTISKEIQQHTPVSAGPAASQTCSDSRQVNPVVVDAPPCYILPALPAVFSAQRQFLKWVEVSQWPGVLTVFMCVMTQIKDEIYSDIDDIAAKIDWS